MDINFKIKKDLDGLSLGSQLAKLSGHIIVLTSGCFDLLHGGHLEYLCEAGALGYLVVGINSDNFVKRLKGANRPIRDENDRAYTIAGFSPVKLVSIFDCDYDLIEAVQPDIYVASSTSRIRVRDDRKRMEMLNDIGAKIVELDGMKNDSTSAIIRRAAVCVN